MQSMFLLGQIKITPAARRTLKRLPYDLIARHSVLDHGQIDESQWAENELGLRTMGRILSRYRVDPTDPDTSFVLIVTEETWRETVISLERELVATPPVAISRRQP
jgi:hypothetical protein